MTKTQQRFFNLLKQQIVDFDETFHKQFMIQRISQIPDDQLKYLLENINLDKDKISKKGYITYAKFIHYCDKMLDNLTISLMTPKLNIIDKLLQKRDQLIRAIDENVSTLEEKNRLINDIKDKKLMFKVDNKNILNKIDYFLIDKFGYYNFFDETRNYHIKDELQGYLKEYINNSMMLSNSTVKQIGYK